MDQDNERLTPLPRITTPTFHNPDSSSHVTKISFTDLPWEIRDQIYTHALTIPHPIRPYNHLGITYPSGLNPYHPPLGSSIITLLLLNSQIHDEARLILYTQNAFCFSMPSDLSAFDGSIGARNASLVKKIVVKTAMWTWHVEKHWELAFKGLRMPGLWGVQDVVVVMVYMGIEGWEEWIEFKGVEDLLGDWMRKGLRIAY